MGPHMSGPHMSGVHMGGRNDRRPEAGMVMTVAACEGQGEGQQSQPDAKGTADVHGTIPPYAKGGLAMGSLGRSNAGG